MATPTTTTTPAKPMASQVAASAIPMNVSLEDIVAEFSYSHAMIATVRNTIAKDATLPELAYFFRTAKSWELDPFKKEIFFYKDKNQKITLTVARDGFRALAQRKSTFLDCNSMEVRDGDTFAIKMVDGEMSVLHEFSPTKDRLTKQLLGAYAVVRTTKGGRFVEWADFARYKKYNTWESHPEEMIKKVAEAHALKKAFGFSGLYIDEELDKSEGGAFHVSAPSEAIATKDQIKKIESLGGTAPEGLSFSNALGLIATLQAEAAKKPATTPAATDVEAKKPAPAASEKPKEESPHVGALRGAFHEWYVAKQKQKKSDSTEEASLAAFLTQQETTIETIDENLASKLTDNLMDLAEKLKAPKTK